MKKFFFTLAALLTPVISDSAPKNKSVSDPSKAPIARGVDALQQDGLENCAMSLNTLVKDQMFEDQTYGYLTHPSSTPNANGSSLITAKTYADGSIIGSFHVVPDAGDGCSLFVHMTIISGQGCAKLRDTTFSGWDFAIDLGRSIAYKLKGQVAYNNNAILTKTDGGGCVADKIFTLNYPREQ